MKIRHERPMSDLSFQVCAPLGLELSTGERLTISDWSIQGFEFPNESDVLPKEAVLSIPFQGVDIRFPIKLKRDDYSICRIVRILASVNLNIVSQMEPI